MAITTLPYPNMDFTPLDVLTADELDQLVANINAINNASIPTGAIADSAITTPKIADSAITAVKMSGASAPIATDTTAYGTISSSTSKTLAHSGFLTGKAVVGASGSYAYVATKNSADYAVGGIPYYEGGQNNPNIQVVFCVPVYKGQTIYLNCSANGQFENVKLVKSNFDID